MAILTHLYQGPSQSSYWLQPTLFSPVANLAGNVLRLPASHPCIRPHWPSLAWAGHTPSKRLAYLQSCQSLELPTTFRRGALVPGTSKLVKGVAAAPQFTVGVPSWLHVPSPFPFQGG